MLVAIGVTHHNTPIEIRERVSVPESVVPALLRGVLQCGDVREAAALSTCNRTELYAECSGEDSWAAGRSLMEVMAAHIGTPASLFQEYLFIKAHAEAATHLMRVACGLDSLVLGEAQILGQVKTALQQSHQAGAAGPILSGLFQQAISTGKRVITETGLGRGAFSIGHAAVDLAAGIFSDLAHAAVLLIGAGKVSELTARHLVESGVKHLAVANRSYPRAASLAQKLGGAPVEFSLLPEALSQADIVITSTAAPQAILRRETLTPILRKRKGRPLFLIDIAVPRNIAPDVAELENVFLYNIDHLQEVVAEDIRGRESEREKAEAIATDEAAGFLVWYQSRKAAPLIDQLQRRLEAIREEDFALLKQRLPNLSERDWNLIEAAGKAMMRKVAREPILRLKRESVERPEGEADRYNLMAAAREIFGLFDPGTAPHEQIAATEEEPELSFTGAEEAL
ncbi:MAG TPA: glutamyl-tRNA reductase [Chthonomonadales bacterium]|nr:glutamyl-tRNA reductase [Chthonomonadales bacterium]